MIDLKQESLRISIEDLDITDSGYDFYDIDYPQAPFRKFFQDFFLEIDYEISSQEVSTYNWLNDVQNEHGSICFFDSKKAQEARNKVETSATTPEKSGWLEKLNSNSTWEKRWVVVKEPFLCWYQRPEVVFTCSRYSYEIRIRYQKRQ